MMRTGMNIIGGNFLCTNTNKKKLSLHTQQLSRRPIWNPWQEHARFFWRFSQTRQEIIQFTCKVSAETVTLHPFFHSENHISMQTFSLSW